MKELKKLDSVSEDIIKVQAKIQNNRQVCEISRLNILKQKLIFSKSNA